MTIAFEDIQQAVARGWCTPANENKTLDPDLADAITTEVYNLLNGEQAKENPGGE
jgi:hypothetical protein